MTMTRENGVLLLVSAFIGAFGAALLSAGVGLNFVTVATITIFVIYALRVAPRKDVMFGLIGIVIGIVLQVVTPIKVPVDSQLLAIVGMLLLSLQA